MRAGKLRQRITIQSKQEVQDSSGDVSIDWAPFATNVPAGFQSGPGREFLAAEAIRAEVVGRFTLRYTPGITAEMRVLWDDLIWNIKAPPIVDSTARREITLLVGAGVNDG